MNSALNENDSQWQEQKDEETTTTTTTTTTLRANVRRNQTTTTTTTRHRQLQLTHTIFPLLQFTASLPTASFLLTSGMRLYPARAPSPHFLLFFLSFLASQRNGVEQRVLRQSVGRVEGETSRRRVYARDADASEGRGRAGEASNGSLETEELRARLGHEDGSQRSFLRFCILGNFIDINHKG